MAFIVSRQEAGAVSICRPSTWQLYFIFTCKLIDLTSICCKCVFPAQLQPWLHFFVFWHDDLWSVFLSFFLASLAAVASQIYLTGHVVFVLPCMLWKIAHLTSATVSSDEECNNPTTRNASFPQRCLYSDSSQFLGTPPGENGGPRPWSNDGPGDRACLGRGRCRRIARVATSRVCTAAASSRHWTSIDPSPISHLYLSWDKSIMSSSISLC